MATLLSHTQKQVFWCLVGLLWAWRQPVKELNVLVIHKMNTVLQILVPSESYPNISGYLILEAFRTPLVWLMKHPQVRVKTLLFSLKMYDCKHHSLCSLAVIRQGRQEWRSTPKKRKNLKMLTKSFPLAIAKESGEWPLHNVFGFAWCVKRRQITSLACFVGKCSGKE